MKKTLLVMAAGMGSRYGGIKQIDPVGKNGETIIDYSIYDAYKVGFNKIVFIIRKDIEKDFKDIVLQKLQKKYTDIEFILVYQGFENIPQGFSISKDRIKPLGTTQAILSAKDNIDESFTVINADDFYGKDSFELAFSLMNDIENKYDTHGMVGFYLKNTMSKNGSVSRGLCHFKNEKLSIIEEHKKIYYENNEIKSEYEDKIYSLTGDEIVSMNMFVLNKNIFPLLQDYFVDFLKNMKNLLKDECLIPQNLGDMVAKGIIKIECKNTTATWFGVTYKEDKPEVISKIQKLIDEKLYPQNIY